ncbi:NYN domain-containing protein [Acinetobacter colistiniresistens]|uniref:NYN domain-containing protein n=1 Tax=Acinetobacter colistiniresistens TaxID=280145 RepID=UPI00211CFC86|nr:NYN domain-containing protein [Acinetobacter colistiniresistens]UUM29006.1 NYN domain-containing protein [Acinetobacter colistiniresistens]
MSETNNLKLAVLIDADNAQASVCENLLKEIARFGTAHIKRIYGDWTKPNLKSWKEELHKHAIQPVQQFSYTSGKNATDSALIIDAMDLLHQSHLDGFCLISSDSDFTRLATRIRENGLVVYGFGEKKTPNAFIVACDQFIFVENLTPKVEEVASTETEDLKQPKVPRKVALSKDKKLKDALKVAINASSKDSDWAALSGVGGYMIKSDPSFDPRSYGYEKLSALVENLNYLEIDKRKPNDSSQIYHMYIRLKVS